MSINPSNFIGVGSTDLGTVIQTQTSNQITATFTFPSNTTTINKQSIAFSNPVIIDETDITAQMDGSPLNGDQVYTFGPAIQNRFVAMGTGANGGVYSNDGIVINPISAISSNTSSAIYWDGNKWIGSINHVPYYSYNGINWQSSGAAMFSGGNTWSAYYNGSIYLIVAIGSSPNHMAYSYDGINWTSIVGFTTTSIYAIAWNGTVWLAGGNGTNTLAYSYDGITWTISTSGNGIFTAYCLGLAWIGDKWVGVGQVGSLPQIAYTTDPNGATGWTAISGISTLLGGSEVESICWNGKILCVTCVTSTNLQAYSYDGITWFTNSISKVFTSSGSTAAAMAWNGRLFLAANPGNTGNSLAYSYNGINWTGLGNAYITSPYCLGLNNRRLNSIKFQRNLTIVGGQGTNTLAYSLNGINWTGITNSVFSVQCNAISYNGRIWIGGGYGANTLAFSKDGLTWYGLGANIFSTYGYRSIWNSKLSIWVCPGVGINSMAYSYDGMTWIPSPSNPFSSGGSSVTNSASLMVAVGRGVNTFAYSTNGITWTGIGNPIITTVGYGIATNGSLWVALGQSGSAGKIAYSYNGTIWKDTGYSGFTTTGRAVAWNGSMWVAVGQGTNSTAYSYDGITWQTGTNIFTGPYGGLGVCWNGTCWIVAGTPGTYSMAYSYDGINWVGSAGTSIFSSLAYDVTSNYNIKPIPFIQHPTLALGSGSVTMAYSPDGINWTSLRNTPFSTQANCAFWNGTMWLAGGEGGYTMAYSYDGVQWTGISSAFSPFSTSTTGIAYNGNTWVAVGESSGTTSTVAYSYDAKTWTNITVTVYSNTMFKSVTWNGSCFMILAGFEVGTLITGGATSTNGINWTGLSPGSVCNRPASNGYTWVAPRNQSPGLLYVNNPLPGSGTWTGSPANLFYTCGYCVCYGGTIWLAGGLGGNTLAYSYNGTTWVGLGTTAFPNGCTSICWNGTRFVGAGGNYTGYSKDGITWYSSQSSKITSLNCVVSNPGIGAFVAPSAMVLNNNGITGNGISASQNLEFVSSDPYYQSGFDNVAITLNTKYNQQSPLSYTYTYQNGSLMNGCYSVRLVVPSYTGPVINVMRSSDNTSAYFYTDATQSYLTSGPNNTGTTFASWSSGSSFVYLNIWYDQSGKSNHCTQTVSVSKPTIVLCSNIYVVYFSNLLSTGTFMNIKDPNTPYTVISQFNNVTVKSVCNSIVTATSGDFSIRLTNNSTVGANANDWVFIQGGTKYSYVNGVSTGTIILGLSFNTLAYSNTIIGTSTVLPFTLARIGTDGYDPLVHGMNGYMTEFIMYNTPLQPTDLVNYNNTIINPSAFKLPTYMYCCYSARLFVPTYTGPVFRATRSTDLSSTDFYTDVTQTYLTTGANNTGTSFATWSSGATVYGNIWYDQSGKSNHLTQTNQINRPIITYYSDKCLFYFNSSGATPQYGNITTPMNPYSVLSTFNNVSLNSYNAIASATTDFSIRFSNNSVNGNSSASDWYYSQPGTIKFNYVNGVSTTSINLSSSFTSLGLSTNTVAGAVLTNVGFSSTQPATRSLNGYMTEFVAYNTQLAATDFINYNTFCFKPNLFQLPSIMLGCYSVRLFVPSYIGPVFNLIRSTDLSSLDFYTNSTQSYVTTGPNNTGTTLATWSTGATIYGNIWYDQSGKGNHCTTSTTLANKPTLVTFGTRYLFYFISTTNPQDFSFNTPMTPNTILTEFNNVTTNTYNTIASANPTDFGIRIISNNTVNVSAADWYYNQSGTKYSYINGISTNNIYLSLNYNTLALSAGTASGTPLTNIGIDGFSPTTRSFNGYMTEFVAYNTALPPDELVKYNNFKLI